MAGRGNLMIRATHRFVPDPTVAETLIIWGRLLAEAVRRRHVDSAAAGLPQVHRAPGMGTRPPGGNPAAGDILEV